MFDLPSCDDNRNQTYGANDEGQYQDDKTDDKLGGRGNVVISGGRKGGWLPYQEGGREGGCHIRREGKCCHIRREEGGMLPYQEGGRGNVVISGGREVVREGNVVISGGREGGREGECCHSRREGGSEGGEMLPYQEGGRGGGRGNVVISGGREGKYCHIRREGEGMLPYQEGGEMLCTHCHSNKMQH